MGSKISLHTMCTAPLIVSDVQNLDIIFTAKHSIAWGIVGRLGCGGGGGGGGEIQVVWTPILEKISGN